MAFKVNYNQQRAERNRAKLAKKEAKLREREDEVARRKAAQAAGIELPDSPAMADDLDDDDASDAPTHAEQSGAGEAKEKSNGTP